MDFPDIPESWLFPPSLQAAAETQRELAGRVVSEDRLPELIGRVGGVDVSNTLRDPANMIYAAAVSLSLPELAVTGSAHAAIRAPIPYVPGFLAFREVPALVEACRRLEIVPDVIMVDGHGVSHPRGLGIASHLGVLLDCPAIGVAKSILVGQVEEELGPEAGSTAPLVWKNRQIGVALRTRNNVKPVYVSAGHRVCLETAVAIVKHALSGYRLPEPTRQAHMAANAFRKAQQG